MLDEKEEKEEEEEKVVQGDTEVQLQQKRDRVVKSRHNEEYKNLPSFLRYL